MRLVRLVRLGLTLTALLGELAPRRARTLTAHRTLTAGTGTGTGTATGTATEDMATEAQGTPPVSRLRWRPA